MDHKSRRPHEVPFLSAKISVAVEDWKNITCSFYISQLPGKDFHFKVAVEGQFNFSYRQLVEKIHHCWEKIGHILCSPGAIYLRGDF